MSENTENSFQTRAYEVGNINFDRCLWLKGFKIKQRYPIKDTFSMQQEFNKKKKKKVVGNKNIPEHSFEIWLLDYCNYWWQYIMNNRDFRIKRATWMIQSVKYVLY